MKKILFICLFALFAVGVKAQVVVATTGDVKRNKAHTDSLAANLDTLKFNVSALVGDTTLKNGVTAFSTQAAKQLQVFWYKKGLIDAALKAAQIANDTTNAKLANTKVLAADVFADTAFLRLLDAEINKIAPMSSNSQTSNYTTLHFIDFSNISAYVNTANGYAGSADSVYVVTTGGGNKNISIVNGLLHLTANYGNVFEREIGNYSPNRLLAGKIIKLTFYGLNGSINIVVPGITGSNSDGSIPPTTYANNTAVFDFTLTQDVNVITFGKATDMVYMTSVRIEQHN